VIQVTLPRILAVFATLASLHVANAQFAVSSTQPGINANNVARTAPIVVNFDRPVNPSTFVAGAFHAFARTMGPVAGSLSFSNNDTTVTLTPASAFLAGDVITLYMSHDLRAADGAFLRQAGYTVMFTIAAAPSAGRFCHRTTFTDRLTPLGFTNIYGGLAGDLNRDGAPDLTIVNEYSGDLRTYLNDGTGSFLPMLTPASIPIGSSPNEPADFNGDGFIDVVLTSYQTHEIAIRMGNGNGTWAAPTLIGTDQFPLGDAVLDFDGDGDMDIAASIRSTDHIALLANIEAGNFSFPLYIPSGGDGPYALAAADMNNDGILDLVVGHVFSETVVVLRGNGNGTFTQVSSRATGGSTRVISCGDVNNDGFMDVSVANSASDNGAILKGNGNGTLQEAVVVETAGSTSGTELVDIDGDGDLDWLMAAYGAERWYLYQNNGSGDFSLLREFMAPANPACSVTADFDRDGDIDLILLDETEDLVLVMINSAGACYGNCDCSDGPPALTANDFVCYFNKFIARDPTAECDGAGDLTANDFLCFLTAYASGCS
jgi:hypothetical protein